MDAVQISRLRKDKAKPILDEFKDWLKTNQPLTPPKGLLGQAISYTLANWEKLIICLEDGTTNWWKMPSVPLRLLRDTIQEHHEK